MNDSEKKIWQLLADVPDPEIPVLSVLDLGIVRAVDFDEKSQKTVVTITPTYSGCPAMSAIEINIRAALEGAGFLKSEVKSQLAPAWTTDWLSASGRSKLLAYGIAPPVGSSADKRALFEAERHVGCPLCGSENTELVSQFGSTSCKALWRCRDCREPFDYFKCH